MTMIRFLVLSDLHAHDSRFTVPIDPFAPPTSPGQPSWLDYANVRDPTTDPILGLKQLVADTPIQADFLIVPGDICDKANGAALALAWGELQEIQTAIGAQATIATAGNHDVDSRYRANPYDPKEALQELRPLFPLADEPASASFWGYHIAQSRSSVVRFVVVNSCAYHGGREGELTHGRIARGALRRLSAIAGIRSSVGTVNVLLCHHHPYPISGNQFGNDDRMIDGETMLDILDESGEQWLIIHGHRHAARVLYAAGSATSPTLFAAGSVSVRLSPELTAVTRNQAHLITVNSNRSPARLFGTVESWNYVPEIGWTMADDAAGLPARCGFGFRGPIDPLVDQVEQLVRSIGGPTDWSTILSVVSDVEHLIPRDFNHLRRRLEERGIEVYLGIGGAYEAAIK